MIRMGKNFHGKGCSCSYYLFHDLSELLSLSAFIMGGQLLGSRILMITLN